MPEYEPATKLAADILMSNRFTPGSEAHIVASIIIGKIEAPLTEVQAALADFDRAGLVTAHVLQGIEGTAYKPTKLGWLARERLLRRQGLRHSALLCQEDHELGDLVVALVMAPHVENDRPSSAGVLGRDTGLTVEQLEVLCSSTTGAESPQHATVSWKATGFGGLESEPQTETLRRTT